jgi:succinoglycan biosynthesis protein ExoV
MRLYVWRGLERNFGDELNTLLWPRLAPGLLDADEAELFLGIGSVLDARHPAGSRKVVAGAGYGGYEPPASLDGSWVVYWVRGPRTARLLGLPSSLGLGDPASLLPIVCPIESVPMPGRIGFMPHFESLARGAWPEVCEAAGVTLIDPRGAPETILAAMATCRLLMSEALHGVIVADALRVPWVALTPIVPVHRAKWLDWADSLGLMVRFAPLAPSSSRERSAAAGAWAWTRRVGRDAALKDRAVSALRRAAAASPQLSDPAALDRARARMLSRLHMLRSDRMRPHQRRDVIAATASALASLR